MKKLFYFIAILISTYSYSQSASCGSDEFIKTLTQKNPSIKSTFYQMDKKLNDLIVERNFSKTTSNLPIITIPIAIIVAHGGQALGTGSNITDTQINNQITALNSYFSPYGIRFCLATNFGSGSNNPSGGIAPTAGISHVNVGALTNHNALTDQAALIYNSNLTTTASGGQQYLRIWIVNSITGLTAGVAGYSAYPNSGFEGIVMRYDVFGNGESNLMPNYNQGKALVHEVGHYLGLYHTFNESCLGGTAQTCTTSGDRVCDTPQVSASNFGCPASIDSCPTETPNNLPDDIHNYMDYTYESCKNQFTPGQVQRMKDMLTQYRNVLFSTDNLIATATCGANLNSLSATFTASAYSVCTNSPAITFNPVVTQNASYTWNFGDGSSTSSLMNPSHSFTSSTNSPFTVTLTIVRANETLVSTQKIYVTTCNPIQNSDSNWYVSENSLLNFGTGVPVPFNIPNNLGTGEALASQCNAQGNLLFYSNGLKIFNNVYTSINSSNLSSDQSAMDGVISVPKPGNINQYYLFTKPSIGYPGGFRYSIINISGTTATLSATFDQPITFPSSNGYQVGNNGAIIGSEGIAVAENCSGYWIVTTGVKSNGEYLMVYNLTSAGLVFVGETLLPAATVGNQQPLVSSIKFSPDENKLIFYRLFDTQYIYLYEFNKFTGGVVGSPVNINLSDVHGISFSPDSKLFYANSNGNIYQLNCISTNINSTKKLLYVTQQQSGNIQLGPDGKIYGAVVNTDTLFTIHNPNGLVTENNPNNCDFTRNGVKMLSTVAFGLNNIINAKASIAFPNSIATISSYPISCNSFKFIPNIYCNTPITWDFGDSTTSSATLPPVHTYSVDGTYTISIKNSNNIILASTTVIVGMNTPTILGSSSACSSTNNNTTINSVALETGQTAHWTISGGTGIIGSLDNQSEVIINWTSLPGTISLTVTNSNGCSKTVTKTISGVATPIISGSTDICLVGNKTSINSISLLPGQTASWSIPPGAGSGTITGGNTATATVTWTNVPGILKVTVTDVNGCSASAYQQINRLTIVTPIISGDTCYSSNTVTNHSTIIPAGLTALWSASTGTIIGSNSLPNVKVNWSSPGLLSLTFTNNIGCTATSYKSINKITTPVITGNNNSCITVGNSNIYSTTLGSGETALWTITSGAGTITNGNTANASISWSSLPATLNVTITNANGCTSSTTMNVGILQAYITGTSTACTSQTANNTKTYSTTLASNQTALWQIIPSTAGTFMSGTTSASTTPIIKWTSLPATLKLTITQTGGCSVTKTLNITSLCSASCSCLDDLTTIYYTKIADTGGTSISVEQTTMSDLCDGFVTFNFDFGDGTTSGPSGNYVDHCYPSNATYNVVCTATMANGCSRTISFPVTGFPCTTTPCTSCPVTGKQTLNQLNNSSTNYNIEIKPNPTNDLLNVRINNYVGKVNIQVIDINGRVVSEYKNEEFNIEKSLNLNNLQTGMYVLKVSGDSLNFTQKIMKN